MVSIIVPIYKVEKYLNRCVESLVSQTYKDIEIILVDDESPDNCPAICDEWATKDKRIKVIHKQNGGVSSARNAGLDIAKGDFVCFVDSDDFVESTYVEKLLSKQEETNADLVICAKNTIFFNKVIPDDFEKYNKMTNEEILCDLIHSWNFGVVWNKLYKRSLIKDRFDETLTMVEDLPFNTKYFKNVNTFAIVTDTLYNYTKAREGALTTKIKEIPAEELIKNHLETIEILKEKRLNSVIPHQNAAFLKSFINILKPFTQKKLDKENSQKIKALISSKEVQSALSNYKTVSFNEKMFIFLLKKKWLGTLINAIKIMLGGGVKI